MTSSGQVVFPHNRGRRPSLRSLVRLVVGAAAAGFPLPAAAGNAGRYAAGRMFWFTRKTLSGSYAAFTLARRS